MSLLSQEIAKRNSKIWTCATYSSLASGCVGGGCVGMVYYGLYGFMTSLSEGDNLTYKQRNFRAHVLMLSAPVIFLTGCGLGGFIAYKFAWPAYKSANQHHVNIKRLRIKEIVDNYYKEKNNIK